MRVTTQMGLRATMRNLGSNLERLQTSQRQLSTGKRYARISDDPRGATDTLFLRGRLQRHEQTLRTADDTKARLMMADTTLLAADNTLLRANELALRAANTGASDPAARNAIGEEVRALRSELLSAANTHYLGRSLFAGTAAGEAYDTSTGTFLGDTVVEFRTVAENVQVPGNLTGHQVFGDPSGANGDLFDVLDRLADAIDADDTAAIQTEHLNLQVARTRLGSALSEVGRRVAQIDDIQSRGEIQKAQLIERLSLIEDVDLAQAVIDVQTNDDAYQAALAATARAMPPSLVDFMR